MQVHSVLESLQQGILICDQHSRIVFFNQVYGDFIGVPLETAKGHKITEYRKSAIAPEVIESGIPVEGMVRREGAQEYFASVYPIWEENHIRGSISIVTSLVQFEQRETKAHMTLEERVRRFERQEIQNTLLFRFFMPAGRCRGISSLAGPVRVASRPCPFPARSSRCP